MPSLRSDKRWAFALVILIGVVLRTIQYGAFASLSSDEAAVAINVIDRDLLELLFQPLMYYQVAPLGFLALEKLSVGILGDIEAAFRLFPYLLSLASLPLFWRVAARYLGFATLLAALIVFAMSPTLVLYGGMAKQYSGDIAVTLLLLWMALRCLEGPLTTAGGALFGIAGGLALLLSHAAVLVAGGLGVLLLLEGWRAGRSAVPRVALCAGWAIGAAVLSYTSLATYSTDTSEFMASWWRSDFVPPPWLGLAELLWIPSRVAGSVAYTAAYVNSPSSLPEYGLVAVYGLLLLAGAVHLARKNGWTAAALAVPLLVAIAAAAFRLLPLSGRVSLFLGPALLIWCFGGFDGIRTWLPAVFRPLVPPAALALAILPVLALLLVIPPPIIQADTSAIFREVRSRWRPEDELVVSRGIWARVSSTYYGNRFGVEGWTHLDRLWGQYTAEEVLRGYLSGIDAHRGSPRTWYYLDGLADCEREAMLGYLSAIGTEIYSVDSRISKGGKVSAHLYDLSDPELLGTASAATWPVPECRD
jgi:hypothetical protein